MVYELQQGLSIPIEVVMPIFCTVNLCAQTMVKCAQKMCVGLYELSDMMCRRAIPVMIITPYVEDSTLIFQSGSFDINCRDYKPFWLKMQEFHKMIWTFLPYEFEFESLLY